MTYKKLIKLKYQEGVSTHQLKQMFPDSSNKINEVALADISDKALRRLIENPKQFARILGIKKLILGLGNTL